MHWKISVKIAVAYLLLGFFWILFSEWALASIVADPDTMYWFQTFKGLLFIAFTACIFFYFIDKQVARHHDVRDKLRETEDRYASQLLTAQERGREILELASVVLFKIDLVKKRFEYFSPAITAMTGFESQAIMDSGFSWVLSRVHAEDRGQMRRFIKELTTKKTTHNEYATFECRFQNKAGDYRWLSATVKVLHNASGVVESAVGHLLDVTREKEVTNRLEKFEHMVSSSRDMMCLIDRNYVYQEVNSVFSQHFNKSREEIVGKTVSDIIGHDVFEKTIKPFADKCLKGYGHHRKEWVTTYTGEKRMLDISYFPHLEKKQNGEIPGYVVISRDITKTQQLEEKLRQAYKVEAIGTLAGGIAHDFNNILSAIMGYTEVTMDLLERDSECFEYVQRIYSAGLRASELIKQILSFSRQTDQEVTMVQMGPIVKEALKLIRASLPTSIDIRYNIRAKTMVESDPTQLHQIIMNLCANAGYAMAENGGVLTVSLHDVEIGPEQKGEQPLVQPGRYIKLTVSDTGCGMTPEVKRRAFDPFFTTKPKGIGTGMGLSQVHGIVESCQGSMSVFSEPGQGATFNVYLPALEGPDQEGLKKAETAVPGGSEAILFVDDETFLIELAEDMLKMLGYNVTAVSSSVDALKMFDENPTRFDLVITDYAMPNMTGDKLAVEILKRRPGVPIIMATGFGDRFTEESIKNLGIRKLILKPILRKDMAFAIRETIDEEKK